MPFPCPVCNRGLSFQATECPGCGHPITDEVKEQWKANASFKKSIIVLVALAVLVSIAYGAIQDFMAGPSGDVKDTVLKALYKDHPHINSWAGDDLYGGTAVLINDEVGFWVKDGFVYATNGVAQKWGPSMGKAPFSVDLATVEKAAKGDGPDMPPNLGILYVSFYQDVAGKVPQAKISGESIASYKFDDRVHVELKEAGGMLTSAYIGFYARKGQNKLPLDIVRAAIMTLYPDLTSQEAGDTLNKLITEGFQNPGTTYTATYKGICWDFTYGQKQDMNFTFRPEAE